MLSGIIFKIKSKCRFIDTDYQFYHYFAEPLSKYQITIQVPEMKEVMRTLQHVSADELTVRDIYGFSTVFARKEKAL
jgi:hypothetical protein